MSKSKLARILALTLAFSLFAIGCGGGDDDSGSSASSSSESSASETAEEAPAEEAPAEGSDGIRVAIVAPSAENDLAFSQSIVDGVSKLTGVSETAITPGTFIVEEAATAIRDYAEAGYDLVIAHGSQYGGPLQEIAPDFPDTAFAW